MYEAIVALVEESDNISDSKKKALLKHFTGLGSYEFLTRVFQRATLGDNKVASSKKRKKAADPISAAFEILLYDSREATSQAVMSARIFH